MEIKLKNINSDELSQLNLTFSEGEIFAITGDKKEQVFDILTLKCKMTGTFMVDGNRLLIKNQSVYQDRIYRMEELIIVPHMITTVEEYLHYVLSSYQIPCQNEAKKIKDALKLVGLKSQILMFPISCLSKTEEKLLSLATSLIVNKEVLLLENPFRGLDMKKAKKVFRILEKLKETYQKTIIFTTDDCEEIYQYSDKVVILKEGKVLSTGSVEEVYSQGDFFKKYEVPIPKAIAFASYVRDEKKVNLDYHKDIRDLIKEIYRKV